jgi:poly(A) polymerase
MTYTAEQVLDALREATRGTEYEERLYLVGGFVRDKVMGLPSDKDDIDLVLEGDALALAHFLHERGVAQHHPVVYPRFGTAMVVVLGRDVELVTARVESYAADSRKPDMVKPGTIAEDSQRRDFTINTLLERLHTGEVLDPTGKAFDDLRDGVIRTPAEPRLTFTDDPLRMMRAVRFAARFGYEIDPSTWAAIQDAAPRLAIISRERIRDEFCKTLLTSRPTLGLNLFQTSGLLQQFAPELLEMVGVTQNEFHAYPVWEHTMYALGSLPADASLVLRLSVLFHDIGKPRTRTEDEAGRIHFYGHQNVGAQMSRELMGRLKFSNDEISAVTRLVGEHMRIGEYKSDWTDAAVRRLIRDLGPNLVDLFAIHRADVSALSGDHQDMSRAVSLRERIAEIESREDISQLTSPLDGRALMKLFTRPAGPWLGVIKDYLTNEVIEGRLAPDDTIRAAELAREKYGDTTEPS